MISGNVSTFDLGPNQTLTLLITFGYNQTLTLLITLDKTSTKSTQHLLQNKKIAPFTFSLASCLYLISNVCCHIIYYCNHFTIKSAIQESNNPSIERISPV